MMMEMRHLGTLHRVVTGLTAIIIVLALSLGGADLCRSGDDVPTLSAQIDQFRKEGRFQEGIPVAARLVEVSEKTFGPEHPRTAVSLTTLANFYRTTGRFAEAEPLLRRALAIQEKAPQGPNRPAVAQNLTLLGMICNATGRYVEAEPLLRRALDILERVRVQRPEAIAFNLALLAESLVFTGRKAEAEPLMKRAVEIWEKHDNYPPEGMAFSLTLLAKLCRHTGHYAEAEPLLKRSLAICEKDLGENHPNVAFALINLSVLYRQTGRGAEAEPLLKRALAIWETRFGERHPGVCSALSNLGFYYGTTGRHREADEFFRRSVSVQESLRESIFTILTEKQKLSYMKTQEWSIYGYVSHTLRFPRSTGAAVTETFNAWLRWKGSVMEAQGRYLHALSASDDPKVRERFGELTEVKRDIARLQLSGPGKMESDEYRRKVSGLERKRETLERELMAGSREFMLGQKARAADTRSLASTIPKDTVYLDYARITLFDFRKRKWAEPHYLLFVFSPGEPREVSLVDLGGAERVDKHIAAYLREMARARIEGVLPDEKKLKAEASSLYGMLVKPVEPFLKDRRQALISPDGNLNLIPFEALVTPSGAYLIEGLLISYVGAGRDMVKFARPSLTGGSSLIIADPDYDLGQKEMEKAKASAGVKPAPVRSHVSRDARGMHFDRLPDTKEEADAIEKILAGTFRQKVLNEQDKKALEHILFGTRSPRVLHLATHGYFLTEEETKEADNAAELALTEDALQEHPHSIENPMVRSGIVLAGVNTSLKEGKDEGMVTAEKVLGLDLKDTDLVVLSACQTGVGDVKSGEGVFGLKRAFILSGAKTLVMSLWSVPSKETVDLMTAFYALLSEGKTPSEALRQAKLTLMKQKPHPFFWAAFILTGSP